MHHQVVAFDKVPTGAHSFIDNSARCTSGIYEIANGVTNHTSCTALGLVEFGAPVTVRDVDNG